MVEQEVISGFGYYENDDIMHFELAKVSTPNKWSQIWGVSRDIHIKILQRI